MNFLEERLITDGIVKSGNVLKVDSFLNHQMELIQESHPYHHISAIAFNMASYFDHIKTGNPIDVCYSIVENYYRGTANTQLRVKDLRERDELV